MTMTAQAAAAAGLTEAEPSYSADHFPDLAAFLASQARLDHSTGCHVWTGKLDLNGAGVVPRRIGTPHGTCQARRLAWLAEHGKFPPPGEAVTNTCGCRRCINPRHLALSAPSDRQQGYGSVGELHIGQHKVHAQLAWAVQNVTEIGWRPLRLSTIFGLPGPVVDAIRTKAPRASRMILPDGFIRYDLPGGVTVVDLALPERSDDPGEWLDMALWAARQPTTMAA